jgi:viologen exporter family transport system permease protein
MFRSIQRYLQITKTHFVNRSYYRFDLLFDVIRALVVVLVITEIWKEIFTDRDRVGGYTHMQMVLYTCAAAVLSLLYNVDLSHYYSARLRSGDIAFEMTRPVNYFFYGFAEHLGSVLYSLVFAVIPTGLVLFVLFDTGPPASANWLATPLIVVLGFGVYYLFCHVLALTTFYSVDAWGIEYMRINLIRFFAGGFLPLALFPEPLATITAYSPFPYMIYHAASALSGTMAEGMFLQVVLMQTFWIVVLLVIDQILWARIFRRVMVHGG